MKSVIIELNRDVRVVINGEVNATLFWWTCNKFLHRTIKDTITPYLKEDLS